MDISLTNVVELGNLQLSKVVLVSMHSNSIVFSLPTIPQTLWLGLQNVWAAARVVMGVPLGIRLLLCKRGTAEPQPYTTVWRVSEPSGMLQKVKYMRNNKLALLYD